MTNERCDGFTQEPYLMANFLTHRSEEEIRWLDALGGWAMRLMGGRLESPEDNLPVRQPQPHKTILDIVNDTYHNPSDSQL